MNVDADAITKAKKNTHDIMQLPVAKNCRNGIYIRRTLTTTTSFALITGAITNAPLNIYNSH